MPKALAPVNCESCVTNTHDQLKIKRHAKQGHPCDKVPCPIPNPHGHTVLSKIFPFEEKIKNLKIGNTVKQLLLMASNLAPAIAVSEMARPFHVDSFIASPMAISAMHLTNRGPNQLYKLLFTSLSSIGVIALQKFLALPRILIRPIMALAVFFIERNGNGTKGVIARNEVTDVNRDILNLIKLQGQINTVPWLVNLVTSKLKVLGSEIANPFVRFFGYVGASIVQIAGLSLGFVGLGHLIDKAFVKINLVNSEGSLAMRTEGAVCACCGAPVCVAEVASEVGSMSIAI